MKIAMISDVHGHWKGLRIPSCDLLISAGDNSPNGSQSAFVPFHRWLGEQPAKYIISILGNHDQCSENTFKDREWLINAENPQIHYIATGGLEIEGVKIFCFSSVANIAAPNRPAWNAKIYNAIWDKIPNDTEILILHEPPAHILDSNRYRHGNPYCHEMLNRIRFMPELKLCVFGHIHAKSGECDKGGIHFVNASICNEFGFPDNPVREYEFRDNRKTATPSFKGLTLTI